MRRFVVVEGLIGVGKTSLCRLLEREWGARLVLEPAATNPFLESYYADPARYAFPVQMFYLYQRWRQQQDIVQGDLFSQVVVSDYLFEKDRLFAEKTLRDDELELYEGIRVALGEISPVPDLVVYLHAPVDVLMGRIAQRAAPGEEKIEPAYLVDLVERYERLWARWNAAPLLRIDNRDMDYVRDPQAASAVLARIESALEQRGAAPGSAEDREDQPALFPTGR